MTEVQPGDSRESWHRVAPWLVALALGLAAYLWYSRICDPALPESAKRVVGFLLGLPPVIAALLCSLLFLRGRFAPIAAVALAMVLAQRVTIYAHSPDIAFCLGKTIWAARGQPLIDPVLGITTGYPPLFHVIWGWLTRILGQSPAVLLRWSTVWNLVALWFVIWWFGRRVAGTHLASVTLWLASLSLFAKDISEILFASPACASMPLAAAGWWIWATETRWRQSLLGALLLGSAVALWPAHLFGALGVALIGGWRRVRDPRAWLFASSILLATWANWLIRRAVPGGESWSGQQLVPDAVGRFLVTRAVALITLGTDANGLGLALIGIVLLGFLVGLAVIGTRSMPRPPTARSLWRLSLGLFVGALLASWFMTQSAYGIRVIFLAALVITPLAAIGLEELQQERFPRYLGQTRVWLFCAGLVWLFPFLMATAVSSEWEHRWVVRAQHVSDWLSARAIPGERVWASPDTYCDVVLGKMPVFGFLAHRWPLYFSAPRPCADSIATVSAKIATLRQTDDWAGELQRAGVSWVILDRSADSSLPLATTLARSINAAIVDSSFLVYRVPR